MPLSHEEQKLLQQMEQELNFADPTLGRQLLSWRPRRTVPTLLGLLTAACGAAVLILGVASQLTVVGVIGFLMMGASAYGLVGQSNPPTNRPVPPAGRGNSPRGPDHSPSGPDGI